MSQIEERLPLTDEGNEEDVLPARSDGPRPYEAIHTTASELSAFEATYPRYPFAPLVSLAIRAAGWLSGVRRRGLAGVRMASRDIC